MANMLRLLFCFGLLLSFVVLAGKSYAAGPLLIAYGGHNETMVPLWVGIEKGIFRKYGVDPRVLQTRSGPIMMSTLASGGVPLVWAAPSSALNSSVSGFKLTCFAAGNNRIPRELIVRKGIDSLEDLPGKSFGVQSIGGGFWLQTMIVLDRLGVDPDKNGLKMRVIGDEPTILQALLASNIDAAVITFASAAVDKRAGLRSLANTAELKVPYQGTGICTRSDRIVNSPDLMLRLTKGMVEAVALIHEPRNKREVMAVLKKNLRLATDEDAERSYNSLRLVSTLDIAPDPEAWRNIQKYVSRVTPKVAQLDINQIINVSFVRNLEESGFLPEARKKLGL